MKKTLLILFTFVTLLISNYTFAQLQLEHTYSDSTQKGYWTNKYGNRFELLKFELLKLEAAGDKYVYKNLKNRIISIYNLDHSIFKTINIPKLLNYPVKGVNSNESDSTYNLSHISQHLFNLDNKIEFVIYQNITYISDYDPVSQKSNNTFYWGSTLIVNEDGNIIFSGDSILPEENDNDEFIFNTSNGTKMFLTSYQNGKEGHQVYSLPGKLLSAIEPQNLKETFDALPFPNPSNNNISIPYKINSNEIATITITDLMGKTIKSYKVDNTFNSLLVDLNDFQTGTYVYTIQDEKNNVKQGKFIVNK